MAPGTLCARSPLHVDQASERFPELVPSHPVGDVELLEDRLVHEPPALVGGLAVQLLRVVEQLQRGLEQVGTGLDLHVQLPELFGEAGTLFPDAVQSLPDLALGHVTLGRQVEQVLLLDVELRQVTLNLPAQQPDGVALVSDGVANQVPQPIPERGVEGDRGVVPDHGLLDGVHAAVGLGAEVLLLGSAEEVEVLAAVAHGSLHDHPRLALVLVVAAGAPQAALEVVVVLPLALASGSTNFEHLLHPLEGLRRRKCFVPALVLHAVMRDVAEVVTVPQDGGEPRVRDRPTRVPTARAGA